MVIIYALACLDVVFVRANNARGANHRHHWPTIVIGFEKEKKLNLNQDLASTFFFRSQLSLAGSYVHDFITAFFCQMIIKRHDTNKTHRSKKKKKTPTQTDNDGSSILSTSVSCLWVMREIKYTHMHCTLVRSHTMATKWCISTHGSSLLRTVFFWRVRAHSGAWIFPASNQKGVSC